jgi:hypothetical protein
MVLWYYEKQSSIVFLNLLLNSLFWNSFTRSRAKLPPGNAVRFALLFQIISSRSRAGSQPFTAE